MSRTSRASARGTRSAAPPTAAPDPRRGLGDPPQPRHRHQRRRRHHRPRLPPGGSRHRRTLIDNLLALYAVNGETIVSSMPAPERARLADALDATAAARPQADRSLYGKRRPGRGPRSAPSTTPLRTTSRSGLRWPGRYRSRRGCGSAGARRSRRSFVRYEYSWTTPAPAAGRTRKRLAAAGRSASATALSPKQSRGSAGVRTGSDRGRPARLPCSAGKTAREARGWCWKKSRGRRSRHD